MHRIILMALIVIALISADISISIVYAQTKIKIYKVTHVSPTGKLRLRAWPSTKSRVKVSLPHNAKDLLETGKERIIGKRKWVQVKWKDNTGWVNSRYLKKTGVLLRPAIVSRNSKSIEMAKTGKKNTLSKQTDRQSASLLTVKPDAATETTNTDMLPNEYQGDRYDQSLKTTPLVPVANKKMAYAAKNKSSHWVLNCAGSTPKAWNIKMDVSNKLMIVKLANNKEFKVPINYRKWAPGGQIRMEIGGGKGRNLVDATLEKTFACNNGLNKTNYSYRVNAAVNQGELLSGCCSPSSK